MIKKTFKTLLFRIYFLILTFRTQSWVKKQFKMLCELDYDTAQHFDEFLVSAGFASVGVKDSMLGTQYAINESENGEIVVRLLVKIQSIRGGSHDYWQEIYRTDKTLEEYFWVWNLKKIMDFIKRLGIYEARQKELMEKSRNGIM